MSDTRVIECPCCDSREHNVLGVMGSVTYYRCRLCGAEHSTRKVTLVPYRRDQECPSCGEIVEAGVTCLPNKLHEYECPDCGEYWTN